jgi:hypothetical protein
MKPALRSDVNRLLAFPDWSAVMMVTSTFHNGKVKEKSRFRRPYA